MFDVGKMRSVRSLNAAGRSLRAAEVCSGRENSYFGLTRNLIRHLISPNQNDILFSSDLLFPGSRLSKLPNPLSLAGERRPV